MTSAIALHDDQRAAVALAVDPSTAQRRDKRQAPLAERFWRRVDKSEGCWIWLGAKKKYGYGVIGIGGKYGALIRVHRLSWLIHFGLIPDGMHVCHRCDNPPCVRPDHLFLGDDRANLDDMRAKGRGFDIPAMPGERNPNAKLTSDVVVELRKRVRDGVSIRAAAESLSVNLGTAYGIVSRKSWRHIA